MKLEDLIKFYESSVEPCFATDAELNIIFFNNAAKEKFPAICSENGMELLIASDERQGFKALVELMGSSKFVGFDPVFSDTCFYITTVAEEGFIITPCYDSKDKENSLSIINSSKIADTVENLFRTDLSAVLSVLQTLKSNIDPENKSVLDVIGQSSYRVFRTATNVLDYTRLTDRDFHLNRSVFDISEMLKSTVEVISSLGNKKHVKISTKLPKNQVNVFWDYSYMLSAIVGIISNAIKFSVSKANVDITLEEQGENVLITISDEGLGMPPEVLRNCTAPFYSYNFDGKTCNSAGLGLTISSLIANHHSGSLSVDSKQKTGTKVTLSIPNSLGIATEIKSYVAPMPDTTTIMVKLADCLRIPFDF